MDKWSHSERSELFNIRRQQTFWSGTNPVRFMKTLEERHHQYPNRWTTLWVSTDIENYLSTNPLGADIFLSWVESLGSTQSIEDAQDTTLYTEEMKLYIGHNPQTGKYFRGKMTNIGIDPGCGAFGGRGFVG